MTENYIILEHWPNFINGLKILWNKSFVDASYWDPSVSTTFYVIDRNTNKWIATYTTPPFFCFHNINAFEENENIIIDLISYPNSNVVTELNLQKLIDGQVQPPPDSSISRFTLERVTSSHKDIEKIAKLEIMHKGAIELPRINPRFDFKNYRYSYGIGHLFYKEQQPILKKFDNVEKKVITWSQQGCIPAEPIFVPDPNGTKEDDGVILSIILDIEKKNSFLVILDAKDLKELGRATVPQVVPFGFHGNFFGENGTENSYY